MSLIICLNRYISSLLGGYGGHMGGGGYICGGDEVGGTGARGGSWSHGLGVVAPQKKAKKIRGNTDKNRGLPL